MAQGDMYRAFWALERDLQCRRILQCIITSGTVERLYDFGRIGHIHPYQSKSERNISILLEHNRHTIKIFIGVYTEAVRCYLVNHKWILREILLSPQRVFTVDCINGAFLVIINRVTTSLCVSSSATLTRVRERVDMYSGLTFIGVSQD